MTGQAQTPGQAAYELPAIDLHPDDLAEGWIAATYEPDDSPAGVRYGREDMLAIHRAGWDHARMLTAEALAAQERPAPLLADVQAVIRDATAKIARCRSPKAPCVFCEAEIARVSDAASAYGAAVAREAEDECARLREKLAAARATVGELAQAAVDSAKVEDLRQRLDERNAQHKALLGKFSVSGHGIVVTVTVDESSALAVLDAADLARAYTDAGYPVRDDLRHLGQ